MRAVIAATAVAGALSLALPAASADAEAASSAVAVSLAGPPGWWLRQAACIRAHEGWPTAATGNGYEGSYQFLASTYASVGGRVVYRNGRPWHWASLDSLAEQTYRAWLLWSRTRSWSQWGTRRLCGL